MQPTNADVRRDATPVECSADFRHGLIDPRVCFGKPCIRGHRIWVSLVLDLLSTYGAEMSRERYVDIPLETSV